MPASPNPSSTTTRRNRIQKMCLQSTRSSNYLGASLVDQTVENLPAVQEMWVPSLGWEGTPEKGMASHSSILAWRIPWTEESGGLQSMGSQESGLSD